MPKIAVEIDLKQIEKIINQLKRQERITLIQRLEQKAWGERFRSLAAKIDEKRKKHLISRKEVYQIMKEARRERYASNRT